MATEPDPGLIPTPVAPPADEAPPASTPDTEAADAAARAAFDAEEAKAKAAFDAAERASKNPPRFTGAEVLPSMAAETDISAQNGPTAWTEGDKAAVGLARGAVRGIVKGAYNTIKGVESLLPEVDIGGIVIDGDGIRFTSGKEAAAVTTKALETPKDAGTGERIVEAIGQFIGPWSAAGKLIGGVKAGSGMFARAANFTAKGAFADFMGFDPHEGRVSNLLKDFEGQPEITKAIFTYLAADKKDGEAEGRFKNVIEGAFIGMGVAGAVGLAKALAKVTGVFKKVDAAATDAEKAAVLQKEKPALEEAEGWMEAVVAANRAADAGELSVEGYAKLFKDNDLDFITAMLTGKTRLPNAPDASIARTGDMSLGAPVIPSQKSGPGFWEEPNVLAPRNPDVKEFGRVAGPNRSVNPNEDLMTAATRVPTGPSETTVLPLTKKLPGEGDPVPGATSLSPPDATRGLLGDQVKVPDAAPAPAATSAKVSATPAAREAAAPAKAGVNAPAEPATKAVAQKVEVDTEAFLRSVKSGDEAAATAFSSGKTFNYETWNGDTAGQLVDHAVNAIKGDLNKFARAGTVSLERMADDAADLLASVRGSTKRDLMVELKRKAKDAQTLQAYLLAGKALVSQMDKELQVTLAKIGDISTASPAQLAEVAVSLQKFMDATVATKGIQQETARAVTAGRIRTEGTEIAGLIDKIAKDKALPGELRELAYKAKTVAGDPTALSKTLRAHGTPYALKVWMASLLSGPKTHVVNMTSNAMHLLKAPVERTLGSVMKGDFAGAREGYEMFLGMFSGFRDTLKLTAAAWKTGMPQLDTLVKQEIKDADHVAGTLARLSEEKTAVGEAMRLANGVVNLPFRMLTTEDEFFKQLAYRGAIRARLWREGSEQGLSGKALAEFIEDGTSKAFDATGKALDAESLRIARIATFTNPLESKFGQGIQNLATTVPAVRVIIPFIRTPGNILASASQMTPATAWIHKHFRDEIRGRHGPRAQADALGRLGFGMSLWGAAIYAADQELITGGGPASKDARAMMQEAGWQAYSFRRTQPDGTVKYTTFNRLDPFAIIGGLAADFVALAKAGADEATLTDLSAQAVRVLGHNLISKTYMQGAAGFFEMLDSPQQGANFFTRLAGSVVPSGVTQLGQFFGIEEQGMKEVRNGFDAIMARTPGLSDQVPFKRSWLTGERVPNKRGFILPDSVDPYMTSTTKGVHPAAVEMARIHFPLKLETRRIGAATLTPQQEDRFKELIGKPEGRKSLLDAIGHVMQSGSYQRRDNIPPDKALYFGLQDPRHQIIRDIVSAYRDVAEAQLRKEFPAVDQTIIAGERAQGQLDGGRYEEAEKTIKTLLQPRKK